MDDNSKKSPKFGINKMMFTPNLKFKRIIAEDIEVKAEVKVEYDTDSSDQSSEHNEKKVFETSTTQIPSVFSDLRLTSQGRSGSSCEVLSSGLLSYSNHGYFNSSGSIVKTEDCQSIQQMQLSENNHYDVDNPMDGFHKPIQLPFLKKDKISKIKSENCIEYPFQKNVYPSLIELTSPESLMILQFYDSSFSTQTKITNTDPFENGGNDTISVITKTKAPIKMEYDDHIKAEDDPEAECSSQPIGKVQCYESGRIVLIFNGKEYELFKGNEDRHHKELFSLTKHEEAVIPDKLVSLGIVPLRLKAIMDINTIIENF